jgi:hypothetical protein
LGAAVDGEKLGVVESDVKTPNAFLRPDGFRRRDGLVLKRTTDVTLNLKSRRWPIAVEIREPLARRSDPARDLTTRP